MTRQFATRDSAVGNTALGGTVSPSKLNALSAAERAFEQLTTGPTPLTLDGLVIGHGLPAQPVNLPELRDLLLQRSTSDDLKDAVWKELVRQARTGDPAWVLGCVGVALPGLKNTAARALRSAPADYADDVVSELLAEFIAQLARVDLNRRNIAARLIFWARKGALRACARDTRQVLCAPAQIPERPTGGETDAPCLLLDAVRQGIISPAAAELITATRLDGSSLQEIARQRGVHPDRAYKQRRTAEARLADAIREGRLSSRFDERSA
jgi:hypothetical protein